MGLLDILKFTRKPGGESIAAEIERLIRRVKSLESGLKTFQQNISQEIQTIDQKTSSRWVTSSSSPNDLSHLETQLNQLRHQILSMDDRESRNEILHALRDLSHLKEEVVHEMGIRLQAQQSPVFTDPAIVKGQETLLEGQRRLDSQFHRLLNLLERDGGAWRRAMQPVQEEFSQIVGQLAVLPGFMDKANALIEKLDAAQKQNQGLETLAQKLDELPQNLSRASSPQLEEVAGRLQQSSQTQWTKVVERLEQLTQRLAQDWQQSTQTQERKTTEQLEQLTQRLAQEWSQTLQKWLQPLQQIVETSAKEEKETLENWSARSVAQIAQQLDRWGDLLQGLQRTMGLLGEQVAQFQQTSTPIFTTLQERLTKLQQDDLVPMVKEVNRLGKMIFKSTSLFENTQGNLLQGFEALKKENERCKADLDKLMQSKKEDLREAQLKIAKEIITIADRLDSCLAAGEMLPQSQQPQKSRRLFWRKTVPSASSEAIADWLHGVSLLKERVLKLLAALDVQPIECLNAPFDPRYHQAIEVVPGPDNIVVRELSKGYRSGNGVLRYAEVAVGKANGPGQDS